MTITEADVQDYQASITDFRPQPTPDNCYPTAIKNILDELARRKDNTELKLSLSDINDLCNYREGMYTEEEVIPEAISQEIRGSGFRAVKSTAPAMEYDELCEIVRSDDTSLPVVELDPKYFREVNEGGRYRTQGRTDEASHTVIVHKINSDKVLYYDPYEKFFEKSSRVEEAPYKWSRTGFYELWSGDYEERWTFWIERREQSLFDQFQE